jgi:hypothetical protein
MSSFWNRLGWRARGAGRPPTAAVLGGRTGALAAFDFEGPDNDARDGSAPGGGVPGRVKCIVLGRKLSSC